MADYLKIFNTQADYDAYIEAGYPKPNVSYIEDTDETIFTNYKDEPAGPESTLVGIAPEDWPSSVTTIGLGNGTAANEPLRYLIKSIIIPDGVTGFTVNALKNLPRLEELTLPSTITEYADQRSEAYTIVSGDFKLKKLTIPPTVTKIGTYVFAAGIDNYPVNEVYISDLSAWCGISFGSNPIVHYNPGRPVEGNEKHLYLNGKEIVDLVIPEDVTNIKGNVFTYFNQIRTVDIHENVTVIGDNAFSTNPSLTSVTVRSTTPPTLGYGVFNQSTGVPAAGLTIYVPAESVEAYKAAANWSTYASRIQAIPA